jgi:hypothetical protein
MTNETSKKMTVATIGQKLIEYSCSSNQTAEYVGEQVYDIVDAIYNDLPLATYISEQAYSIALFAKSEENIQIEHDEYTELTRLAESISSALEASNDRMERYFEDDTEYTEDLFTIIVGGRIHRFLLGGPQTEALYRFIQHICDENLYPDIK